MRILRSLVAATAVAASAIALAAAPAAADPVTATGKPVKPALFDIVGTGSNTTQFLVDQLSLNYNNAHSKAKHNASHPRVYSWDAVPPGNPTNITSKITTKINCPKILRPDGSGAGVTTLASNTKAKGHFCVDFARSSSFRSAGQPNFAPGGAGWVALARDVIGHP